MNEIKFLYTPLLTVPIKDIKYVCLHINKNSDEDEIYIDIGNHGFGFKKSEHIKDVYELYKEIKKQLENAEITNE